MNESNILEGLFGCDVKVSADRTPSLTIVRKEQLTLWANRDRAGSNDIPNASALKLSQVFGSLCVAPGNRYCAPPQLEPSHFDVNVTSVVIVFPLPVEVTCSVPLTCSWSIASNSALPFISMP